jgi:uncharacterized tellurite resistance protein B-like protein
MLAVVFWKKRTSAPPPVPPGAERIRQAVGEHLKDADDDVKRIVTAIAGLLGCVAYADRVYTDAEEQHVRAELSRVHGLPWTGVDAICRILRDHVAELHRDGDHFFTRELREVADREQRVEVLEVLVDLAAVDGVLSVQETNDLRRLATALGLAQPDYDAAQARHRDKLAVLQRK